MNDTNDTTPPLTPAIQTWDIADRWTGKIICQIAGATFARALEAAVRAGRILTGADLTDADLTDADLTGARLTGARLTDARLTRARLTDARLTRADLTDADLTDADLTGADLTGADLTDADLTDADLTDARLTGARLTDARLTGARLTGADIPVVPDLHRKMEQATRSPEAFDMGNWHSCETTHCRAGWAITLAGEAGKALEDKIGPAAAGALIYHASTGMVPDFFAGTEAARADIERCAKEVSS